MPNMRAVHVTRPGGPLQLVERPIPEAGKVSGAYVDVEWIGRIDRDAAHEKCGPGRA